MMAELDEQTHTPDLQDYELARLQQCAQAPGFIDNLVRYINVLGRHAHRQARATADL